MSFHAQAEDQVAARRPGASFLEDSSLQNISFPPFRRPGHTHTHRQAGKCRYKDVIKMSTSLFHTIYHPLSLPGTEGLHHPAGGCHPHHQWRHLHPRPSPVWQLQEGCSHTAGKNTPFLKILIA